MSASAQRPEALAELLVQRINAADLEGLVALYEPEAVLELPNGEAAEGAAAIRDFWRSFLQTCPRVEPGSQAPALCNGDLALTSTRLPNGAVTAEVARLQPDGTWLWLLDRPNLP